MAMGGLLTLIGVGLMVVGYLWTVGTLFQRDGIIMAFSACSFR